jgi:hypothetical protein
LIFRRIYSDRINRILRARRGLRKKSDHVVLRAKHATIIYRAGWIINDLLQIINNDLPADSRICADKYARDTYHITEIIFQIIRSKIGR